MELLVNISTSPTLTHPTSPSCQALAYSLTEDLIHPKHFLAGIPAPTPGPLSPNDHTLMAREPRHPYGWIPLSPLSKLALRRPRIGPP